MFASGNEGGQWYRLANTWKGNADGGSPSVTIWWVIQTNARKLGQTSSHGGPEQRPEMSSQSSSSASSPARRDGVPDLGCCRIKRSLVLGCSAQVGIRSVSGRYVGHHAVHPGWAPTQDDNRNCGGRMQPARWQGHGAMPCVPLPPANGPCTG